ncbi:Dot/Icm secretion system substrate [Legionella wadsworthii]|uniref:Dot/Icm secretion system substrate n=1 Tax=Legionella wadsworthii TaxID=28088 RepID=A0A378LTI9_9GAMM|nr:hypothetical protein [Legionella wadsworthii]STY29168.1 Dot/Icm secretion system substrate [Legionella wadsworthii]
MPNSIVPFQVNYEKNGTPISAREQAIKILDQVDKLHDKGNGAKKVGITYSANQNQTDTIIDSYQKGKWNTGTSGANQANVISEIEKLLAEPKYQHLKGVYETVPITTMKYDKNGKAAAADPSSVTKSLDHASQFMDNGGVLLGWTNQKTHPNLAIGGGVASSVQPADQKKMISDWVKSKLPQPTLEDDLPLTPPNKTASGTSKMQELQASEKEQAARMKKTMSIKSDQIESLIEAFKKHCDEKWLSDNPPKKNKDGGLDLSFKSEENMADFFKQQASSGRNFIMVDEKTQQVIAFSNGDGKLYRPGKDGPQEITGNSITPKEGEMKDLPTLDNFKMPSKESTQESSSKLQKA